MKLAYTVATPEVADEKICALRGPLEESLKLLASNRYHGVELMVRDPGRLNPHNIKGLLSELNLGIAAVSTGQLRKEDGLQLCHLDATKRSLAVKRAREVIDFSSSIGAPQVNIGTLRGQLPEDIDQRESALSAAEDSFRQLLDYADKKGMRVAVEMQNRFVINWLNSTKETLEWISRFKSPRLSVLFDAYHALFEEPSVYASLIRAFPYISHVQVADSNRLAPGSGQFNFGDFIRVLRSLDYKGYISVEIQSLPDSKTAVEKSAYHLLPLMAENH
jgi:5-keto-L-gluconate epimerase